MNYSIGDSLFLRPKISSEVRKEVYLNFSDYLLNGKCEKFISDAIDRIFELEKDRPSTIDSVFKQIDNIESKDTHMVKKIINDMYEDVNQKVDEQIKNIKEELFIKVGYILGKKSISEEEYKYRNIERVKITREIKTIYPYIKGKTIEELGIHINQYLDDLILINNEKKTKLQKIRAYLESKGKVYLQPLIGDKDELTIIFDRKYFEKEEELKDTFFINIEEYIPVYEREEIIAEFHEDILNSYFDLIYDNPEIVENELLTIYDKFSESLEIVHEHLGELEEERLKIISSVSIITGKNGLFLDEMENRGILKILNLNFLELNAFVDFLKATLQKEIDMIFEKYDF